MPSAKEILGELTYELRSQGFKKLDQLEQYAINLGGIAQAARRQGKDLASTVALESQTRQAEEAIVERKRKLLEIPRAFGRLLDEYGVGYLPLELIPKTSQPNQEKDQKGEQELLFPWHIEELTGRVFPVVEIDTLPKRSPFDLSSRQQGIVTAMLAIKPDETEFVYENIRAAIPDVYADLLSDLPDQVERNGKILIYVRDAKNRSIPGFIRKLNANPEDWPPIFGRFVAWIKSRPEYKDKSNEEIAAILRRENTFMSNGQGLPVTIVETPDALKQAETTASTVDQELENKKLEFSLTPEERGIIAGVLIHNSTKQVYREKTGEIISERDAAEFAKIALNVAATTLISQDEIQSSFLSIAQKLAVYKNHWREILQKNFADSELLLILTVFTTRGKIPPEELWMEMVAAQIPKVSG